MLATGISEHLRQAARRKQCARHQKGWKEGFNQLSNLDVAETFTSGVKPLATYELLLHKCLLAVDMSTGTFSKNTVRIFNCNQNTLNKNLFHIWEHLKPYFFTNISVFQSLLYLPFWRNTTWICPIPPESPAHAEAKYFILNTYIKTLSNKT